ncbi:B-box zinc finger protein [Tumebacillus lipolyticus]|uniref:B-box zinc finger protein n=1 Tax=Tumebacillus lipolyticus TaxID=1280370 RepID=A0ABW4ZVP2_9BACL
MNCHYHPDHPVERECRLCHKLICSDCLVPVGEHAVCKSCVSQTLTLEEPLANHRPIQLDKKAEKASRAVKTVRRKSETLIEGHRSFFLTTLFSCLPGLGHYYLGLQVRGVQLMIVFFGLIFLNTIVPNSLSFATGFAVPILWFYAQVDAHKHRDMINRGDVVDDRAIFPRWKEMLNVSMLGWSFAIIGSIALTYGLFDLAGLNWQLRDALKEMVTAALFLALGVWIVNGKALPFTTDRNIDKNEDGGHA